MNNELETMLRNAEGRYLTPAEEQKLRGFAQTLDQRLQTMAELRNKEAEVVERCMLRIKEAYPDFQAAYPEGSPKGSRDMILVLRFAAMALVKDDPEHLRTGLLTWLKTILRGVGLAEHFVRDAYTILSKEASQCLSQESYAAIEPYLQLVIDELGQSQSKAVAS